MLIATTSTLFLPTRIYHCCLKSSKLVRLGKTCVPATWFCFHTAVTVPKQLHWNFRPICIAAGGAYLHLMSWTRAPRRLRVLRNTISFLLLPLLSVGHQ